jgi:hypothetical protein
MEKLQSDIHEAGPLSREIEVQNTLNQLQQLLSDWAAGGSKNGEDAIAKALLLIFGYEGIIGEMVASRPASICPVFEVDDRCRDG